MANNNNSVDTGYPWQIEEQIKARVLLGLEPMIKKTRKCNVCDKEFESYNTWTCTNCKYLQRMQETNQRHRNYGDV